MDSTVGELLAHGGKEQALNVGARVDVCVACRWTVFMATQGLHHKCTWGGFVTSTAIFMCRHTRPSSHFARFRHTDSITSAFTDLREVLGPHLDFLLHQLLPVESFILQPLLGLLPPPPLLLEHLPASQALPFLADSAFIKYFF